jgi:hypothetical protein
MIIAEVETIKTRSKPMNEEVIKKTIHAKIQIGMRRTLN